MHYGQMPSHKETSVTDLTLSNNGTKLAASFYGPADAVPILFLHGISMSRDTWEEIAFRLMGRYQVWTLDFRGHGHSGQASSYQLADYVSDADTALAAIGRPAIVVGHSLGGCVAGVLAQRDTGPGFGSGSPRAAFLEDPPWYLGEPGEWARSVYPRLFSIVSQQQARWQQEQAPLSTYLDFAATAPSPMGGVGRDHFSPRHLVSFASALQRQDNRCWGNVAEGGEVLAVIDTSRAFQCPVKVIQADPHCGAALLDGHEARLAKTNPKAEIVRYAGCGHRCHAAQAFDTRFVADLESFLVRASMP